MTFKIGEIHPNTPHLCADLFELLVLLGGPEQPHGWHRNDMEALLHSGALSYEEVDEEVDAEGADNRHDGEGDSGAREGLSSAERRGRMETQVEDILAHLNYRAGVFGPFYPFRLENEQLILQEQLDVRQRVYRLLLACSRLRSFAGRGLPQRWAAHFVRLCKLALAGLLPGHAVVRSFDANSEDRQGYYASDLRKALVKLGADLRVIGVNASECAKVAAQGDAGLDLVGIVDFDDGAATAFALLAQCAAQETAWPSKTLEAHPMKFRHFFQMQFDCPALMFTPVCFRTGSGEWCDNQSANGIFLADRGRILQLLEQQQLCDRIAVMDWFVEFERALAAVEL